MIRHNIPNQQQRGEYDDTNYRQSKSHQNSKQISNSQNVKSFQQQQYQNSKQSFSNNNGRNNQQNIVFHSPKKNNFNFSQLSEHLQNQNLKEQMTLEKFSVLNGNIGVAQQQIQSKNQIQQQKLIEKQLKKHQKQMQMQDQEDNQKKKHVLQGESMYAHNNRLPITQIKTMQQQMQKQQQNSVKQRKYITVKNKKISSQYQYQQQIQQKQNNNYNNIQFQEGQESLSSSQLAFQQQNLQQQFEQLEQKTDRYAQNTVDQSNLLKKNSLNSNIREGRQQYQYQAEIQAQKNQEFQDNYLQNNTVRGALQQQQQNNLEAFQKELEMQQQIQNEHQNYYNLQQQQQQKSWILKQQNLYIREQIQSANKNQPKYKNAHKNNQLYNLNSNSNNQNLIITHQQQQLINQNLRQIQVPEQRQRALNKILNQVKNKQKHQQQSNYMKVLGLQVSQINNNNSNNMSKQQYIKQMNKQLQIQFLQEQQRQQLLELQQIQQDQQQQLQNGNQQKYQLTNSISTTNNNNISQSTAAGGNTGKSKNQNCKNNGLQSKQVSQQFYPLTTNQQKYHYQQQFYQQQQQLLKQLQSHNEEILKQQQEQLKQQQNMGSPQKYNLEQAGDNNFNTFINNQTLNQLQQKSNKSEVLANDFNQFNRKQINQLKQQTCIIQSSPSDAQIKQKSQLYSDFINFQKMNQLQYNSEKKEYIAKMQNRNQRSIRSRTHNSYEQGDDNRISQSQLHRLGNNDPETFFPQNLQDIHFKTLNQQQFSNMILLNNSQVKIEKENLDQIQNSDQQNQGSESNKNQQQQQKSDKKKLSPLKDEQLKFPTKASIQKNSSQSIKPFKFGGQDSAAKDEVYQRKMYQLRDFNFKINYSNRLFIQNPETQANYRVYIGRGNNRKLIKNFFQRRWWWTIEDNIENVDKCNFVWTQLKIDNFIQKLPTDEIENYEKLIEVAINKQVKQNNSQNQDKTGKSNISPLKKKIINNNNTPQTKLQAQQQQNKQNLSEENHKRIFNQGDYQDFKGYLNKYGNRDSDLMAEDLQFRFNFIFTDEKQQSKLFKKLKVQSKLNLQSSQILGQEDTSPSKTENNNNNLNNNSENNKEIQNQQSNKESNKEISNNYNTNTNNNNNENSENNENQQQAQNENNQDDKQKCIEIKRLSQDNIQIEIKNTNSESIQQEEEQKVQQKNNSEQNENENNNNNDGNNNDSTNEKQNIYLQSNNHFEFNWHLGNKKALYYNMKQYYQLMNKNVFNFLPLTFHIIKGQQDKEYKRFLQHFKKKQALIKKQEKEGKAKGEKQIRNIWIIKPGEISNRGNGISVCDELFQINRIFYKKEKHAQTGKLKTYIIQEYMDRPFLYKQRKFDIRCYLLITQVNSIMKAYWYEEGYIRTSGDKFTLDDVTDVFVHLTNDAIQKQSETYQKYEDGNKLSYNDFQRYLDNNYTEQKLNFFETVLPKMKQITLDAVKAGYMKIDQNKRQSGFEIFGLDYMIDINFQPWLIEINTNPDITTCSQLLQRLIPNMLENAFRIALDPLFPCPNYWPAPKRHLAQDNILENNKFQLIFDELVDGQEIKELYKNEENLMEQIGDIDEEEEIKSDEEDNLEEPKI